MRRLSAILLSGLLVASTAPAEVESLRNYIAAMVNETIITGGQLDELTYDAIQPLLRTYEQPVLGQKINAMRGEILEQLIENQLILDDFRTSGAKVPDAMVEDEIKERIRHRWHDQATLAKELQAKGMTKDTLRQQIRDDIVLRFMIQKNISSAILISPQKIESYYTNHIHQFQLGNQVKLRMIVLKCSADAPVEEVRKLAKEVCDKLDEGASFAEMATILSEGSEKNQGGDWGWREESTIAKAYVDIASSLKPGQHTGVLGYAKEANDIYWMYQYNKAGQLISARKYGDKVGTEKSEMLEEKKFDPPASDTSLPAPPQEFRLMLVEDKKVARTESLADVRDKIDKELQNQERERLRKKWIERLAAKAFVQRFQ